MMEQRLNTHNVSILFQAEDSQFDLQCQGVEVSADIYEITLKMKSEQAALPPAVKLNWQLPVCESPIIWMSGYKGGPTANWGRKFPVSGASQAPVVTIMSQAGNNRLTFACSEAIIPKTMSAGVVEENACFDCYVSIFESVKPKLTEYETVIRLDFSAIPYYKTLKSIADWWNGFYPYLQVPEHARLPMYSAWYSFHQQLDPEGLEKQCKLAREIGCESIIVDDGWQTSDNNRGYAYCGDWEVAEDKIPDMRRHVDNVHDIGLKYLLWYSVPFVGKHSKAVERFKNKVLNPIERLETYVLDPRFPDVREFLVELYENALKDWDLDGLKLDFIDSFRQPDPEKDIPNPERDYESVDQAVEVLLLEVIKRLQKLKPELLIEFRQSYIGPAMRQYGNMLRAGDVPNDYLGNRTRIVDIRLLCGETAAHSDMIMWHATDTVESAAMQLINIIFSVPQISVLLDKIPQEHVDMLSFYLQFWRQHRDVLLDGEFKPLSPELNYPVVSAENSSKQVVAFYARQPATIFSEGQKQLILINGTFTDSVIVETEQSLSLNIKVMKCTGEQVHQGELLLNKGLNKITIPPAGVLISEN